jgi:hypothetical protein
LTSETEIITTGLAAFGHRHPDRPWGRGWQRTCHAGAIRQISDYAVSPRGRDLTTKEIIEGYLRLRGIEDFEHPVQSPLKILSEGVKGAIDAITHQALEMAGAVIPIQTRAAIQVYIAEHIKAMAFLPDWQPISTAPRDGTWFIAAATKEGWSTMRIVRFHYKGDRMPIGEGSDCWPSPPTIWMHMPSLSDGRCFSFNQPHVREIEQDPQP